MKPTSFSRSSFLGLPVRASFCGLLSGLCCSLFLLCLCSCRGDDDDAPLPPVPDHTAILHLRLGGDVAGQPLSLDAGVPEEVSAITTRAPMTRAVNETAIQTVDVLSFKVDASDPTNIKKGTFFYRAQGVYTETSPGQGKVEVRLTGSPERQTLVVLANARRQVDALGAAYGEQKEDVMSRLTFDAGTDASPDFAKGMPMWGELPNEAVGEGFSPSGSPKEVTMIRSVAKFTLVNPAEHDPEGKDFFFYYDLLRLYNYRSKGRIAPDNYDAAGKKVDTPTVPADARQPRGTFASLDSEVTSGRIGIYEGRQKSFYLCEVDNTVRPSGGNALDDLCLIVYVKSYSPPHSGVVTSGYYRLDFRSYPGDTRMDILRNHDYQIKVESVEGLPAQTADEAYNGNHTLKCKIVPWNQVNEEVKVPAVKRLSVDTRSIRLIGASAMTTGKTLTVTTENTGGWTVTDVPSWLTVSPMSGTADGIGSITVKSNGSSASSFNAGSFKLKAGNAEMAIKVEQVGKLPLEYVAEFNLAGGSQYGTQPNNAAVTGAQNESALRFANSHNNDQSGYYNWYVCKGIYDATYNSSTKNLFSDGFFTPGHPGHGYHLPSRQELTGVFSHGGQVNYGSSSGSVVTVNEACQFGNIKKTFGADYYSTGNGTCYALRFKQATGNPNDGSPLTDFPQATDNSMLCAYRYRCVGSLSSGNNTDRLEIDCVYLGEAGASSVLIGTISNDSWWNTQAAIPGNVITRTFPAAGYIFPAYVSGAGALFNRGRNGYFWSGMEGNSSNAWSAYFYSGNAYANYWYYKVSGFAVRLFASE
ncbi:BACON domain-containing protein [Bacteroides sp. KG123]|uniref:BACON domain-containing protein n=1 Tax=unclassified Bacteroides TaxID=2646097 RepID=UPI003D7F4533